MAYCRIETPAPAIDQAFALLPPFLARYKLNPAPPDAPYPGVFGYGIDEQAPTCADTRDNRWLTWAARYQEPDDAFLSHCGPAILDTAFDETGRERRSANDPNALLDDAHHQYVWWLLQAALSYLYTGDTCLDAGQLRRMVETMFSLYDPEGLGITHTQCRKFVTSIGEPANTDAGQAYSFFHAANNVFSLRTFAALAEARGETAHRDYFRARAQRLEGWLLAFRDLQTGFYYALREVGSGRYTYRVAGPDAVSVMADNVYFPLAFGVLSAEDMSPSVEFLERNVGDKFPYPYAYPAYQHIGCGMYQAWWFPRSWQECLCHYTLAMREIERPSRVYPAIRRQAERIARDGVIWEHYDPDTGEPLGKDGGPRPRAHYSTTAACLNIAIVEALFGLRPAAPGFARLSVRPALPADWDKAMLDAQVNGRRIRYSVTQSATRVALDFAGSDNLPTDVVLPLPEGWEPERVRINIPGVVRWLKGEQRVCLEVSLHCGKQPYVEAEYL